MVDVSESERIACTVDFKANIDGEEQDWVCCSRTRHTITLSDTEPFGGVKMVGYRDLHLSGRSYVYAAMRVTARGIRSRLVSRDRKLSKKITATSGYSL